MSQTPITLSSVQGILKELYDNQKVNWATYKDNPTLAMLPKIEKFPGKYYPVPVVYGLSQGASATFSSAYNNESSPQVAEFLVTRVADFSLASIDGQLLACATTDPGAFIDGSELMIDAAFQTSVNRLASAIFRNGAGTIGQMSGAPANVSGTTYTITLANTDDQVQFEPGMVLNCTSLVDGSGGVSNSNPFTVQLINRNTGVLTGNIPTAATGWTSGYFLAQIGDLPTTSNNNFQPVGSTGTNSLLRVAGFAAWLPLAGPPVSDTFFSVNRNIDTQRLAGVTFDGTALSLEEALLMGTGRIALNGGRVDTGICSYATYTALITSLGSKVQYIDEKIGEIGFRGVQVNGANTVMSVFPDRNCPDGLIYCLTMDDWVLRSQDHAPHILKYLDNIEILRNQDSDSAQLRIGFYGNLYCKLPGHSGVIQVQLMEF